MILGITGLSTSGKDTAANYLVSKGFEHVSLSAILRAQARKQKIGMSRESLIKFGTEIKEKEGHAILAKKALAQINIKKNTLITSIRHPLEVKYFKSLLPNFKLIVVEANPKIRYQRAVERDRSGDAIGSYQEFLKAEAIERGKGGGQEFDEVFKLSDETIHNNGSLAELYNQLDRLIK